jgi:hypothetical protein
MLLPYRDIMNHQQYKIKKFLIVPLGIDSLLLLSLLLVSIKRGGAALEVGLFSTFFLCTTYLFLESLRRRVAVDERGVSIRKLFGEKRISWESITHVGGLAIKNKGYILLTTVAGLFIISNAYEQFLALAEDILSYVDSDRVEEDVHSMLKNTPSGIAGMVLAWVAAVFMTGIIFLKVYTFR